MQKEDNYSRNSERPYNKGVYSLYKKNPDPMLIDMLSVAGVANLISNELKPH